MVATTPASAQRADRYRVSVQQYTEYRRWGLLVVRGLVPPEDVAELRQHTEQLMEGRLPEQQLDLVTAHGHSLRMPPELSPEEKANRLLRIHMLHRLLPLHEKYMLHPRVLDVLEVIIGPDVLALQTMLFTKGPGQPGQGWHQDSYYIPTHPDTLVGAWIAVDDCDEHNGAMWFAKGSGSEPVYPPRDGYGFGDKAVKDIAYVNGVSDTDDAKNDLAKVAEKYDQILVSCRAGDVAFFNGHILHRSKQNITADRFRRSFVSHYCNARSFTQWGADDNPGTAALVANRDPATGMTNASHILARGDTHLPFGLPKFGTPCAALLSANERKQESAFAHGMMGDMGNGLMEGKPAEADLKDDH